MAIMRWNPASDVVNLHSEIDRLFSDLADSVGLTRSRGDGRGDGQGQIPAFLPVDIERRDNMLVITASVPGFEPAEVEITVDRGVLTIDARHTEEHEDKRENVVRRERYTGRMYRQIVLGDGVDGEKANARFENGELIVEVPLVERPQPKRIRVKGHGEGQGSGSTGRQAIGSGESQQSGQQAPTGEVRGRAAKSESRDTATASS